jgi:hypothetical protein
LEKIKIDYSSPVIHGSIGGTTYLYMGRSMYKLRYTDQKKKGEAEPQEMSKRTLPWSLIGVESKVFIPPPRVKREIFRQKLSDVSLNRKVQ